MFTIESVSALEILDSRGRPTVAAMCRLKSGVIASASVPSGASTGSAEAVELRDGDPQRYRGLGCRRAVSNIEGEIRQAVVGRPFAHQAELDQCLTSLDGTPNKARLGANAILAVSIAFARAAAVQLQRPLYVHFAELAETSPRLPRLTINLFSGGKHAGGQAPIQDVLLVPSAAQTIDEALATTFAVYYAAADRCGKKYGMRLLRADEGGLAPPFTCANDMFADAVAAIECAGLQPGKDVSLAVDVASSHFFRNNRYHLDGRELSAPELIEQEIEWTQRYPIVSVEDGLAEDEWDHWPALRQALSPRAIVVGDDFLCTNPERIERAIQAQAANALLLKVNQIGTLTEAIAARTLAKKAGWLITVSARSGETEDDWLADLAVGLGADQIKIGSITQSERLAKYNRLLAIERTAKFPVCPWPRNHR